MQADIPLALHGECLYTEHSFLLSPDKHRWCVGATNYMSLVISSSSLQGSETMKRYYNILRLPSSTDKVSHITTSNLRARPTTQRVCPKKMALSNFNCFWHCSHGRIYKKIMFQCKKFQVYF